MIETRLRIAEMEADHYKSMESFQRDQTSGLGNILYDIVKIVGLEPGGPYDEGQFMGGYSVSRLRDRIQDLVNRESTA